MDFYEYFMTVLTSSLETYWLDVSQSMATAIAPVVYTLLLLYTFFWGWSMMRGLIKEPLMDGTTRILRITTITVIALNMAYYNDFLADMLWNTPDALANVVANSVHSNPNSNMQFLDQMMFNFYKAGEIFNDQANLESGYVGMPDLTLWVTGFFIWLSGVLVTGFAAFLYALAKTMIALLLGIGPIFIALTLFDTTKKFFDAWLGQVVNFVIMIVLTAGTVQLILSIINGFLINPVIVAQMALEPSVNQALPAIIFSLIALLVMIQIPSVSSALGGGVAVGTLGAIGQAYQKIKGVGSSAKDVASGKTLSDYRSLRRQKALNARWARDNPALPTKLYRKVTRRKNRVRSA